MTEELDEYPSSFTDDIMPWERPLDTPVWPYGADKGRPLTDIESRELVRKREWLASKEGFGALIAAIDAVLTERAGE